MRKIFLLFFIVLIQVIDSQGQSKFAQNADSLFEEHNYDQAKLIYQDLLNKNLVNERNSFLKLAYISEQEGNFSRAIYFLSEYYQLNPDESVFDKIYKLAEENSFEGYAKSDFNFILLLFQKYFIYIAISITLILAYSFFIVFLKRARGVAVPTRHKITMIIAILIAFVLFNVPKLINYGIVNKPSINIRSAPSFGAEVIQQVSEGNRLFILGEKDVWVRVLLHTDVVYVMKNDLWIIGQ